MKKDKDEFFNKYLDANPEIKKWNSTHIKLKDSSSQNPSVSPLSVSDAHIRSQELLQDTETNVTTQASTADRIFTSAVALTRHTAVVPPSVESAELENSTNSAPSKLENIVNRLSETSVKSANLAEKKRNKKSFALWVSLGATAAVAGTVIGLRMYSASQERVRNELSGGAASGRGSSKNNIVSAEASFKFNLPEGPEKPGFFGRLFGK
jgi:hypothetical protein